MSETPLPAQPSAAETPIEAVCALADELTKMVGIAQALLAADRQIDLTGFDRHVGLLCAKSLDLPPDEGRSVRPRLVTLFGSVEVLMQVLAKRAPPPH